jgi:hypothetical protein
MHVDDFIVVGSATALKDYLVDSLKAAYTSAPTWAHSSGS